MTPEEIARMQAGGSPRAYYSDYDLARKVRAGELPEELLGRRGATTVRPGTTRAGAQGFNASNFFEDMMNRMGGFSKNIDEPGGLLRNQKGDYRRAGGGKLGAGFGALETALQDPVAGVISAPIGLAGGQLANVATTALTQGMMQGPLPLKAAGMALRYLVPSTVGYQTQQAAARGVQGLLGGGGQGTTGGGSIGGGGGLLGLGSGLQDLSLNLPFVGSVNIGERAKRRAESAYQREELRKDQSLQLDLMRQQSQLNRANELEFIRATSQLQQEANINQMKAMAPILADAQRRELIGNQALMNTQIAGMKSLGRMSGAFDLAGRSQAEAGALARTMAANSPYKAAVLPVPQIQFGG
jgi:hypothetical protein